MTLTGRHRRPLVGHKVPSSFLAVAEALQGVAKARQEAKQGLGLTQAEFIAVLENTHNSDLDLTSAEEISNGVYFQDLIWDMPC